MKAAGRQGAGCLAGLCDKLSVNFCKLKSNERCYEFLGIVSLSWAGWEPLGSVPCGLCSLEKMICGIDKRTAQRQKHSAVRFDLRKQAGL